MIGLKCVQCGRMHPVRPLYSCEVCGGILDVVYDLVAVSEKWETYGMNTDDLLPVPAAERVTIGEGNTPLVKAGRLADRLGIRSLFFKCEFANPTGSFKDRPVSMGVSMARKFGLDQIIVASSGNGAAATSAYCARAGMSAIILVPESVPEEKVKQSITYGARVVKVEGPYSNSFALAKQVGEHFGLFNVTSTFVNPYTPEGDKTVAYELVGQLNGEMPDWIYVPIGAGPLLVGMHKGFEELKQLGRIANVPAMAGIQAEGCSPIARAYREGRDVVHADPNPRTIAGGINDGLHGYAQDGTYTLDVIRRSGGYCEAVTDDEIRQAQTWLAQDEGLFVEPSSAVCVAELKKSLQSGRVSRDDAVVLILTGHGLKDMRQVQESHYEAPIVPNDARALIAALQTDK